MFRLFGNERDRASFEFGARVGRHGEKKKTLKKPAADLGAVGGPKANNASIFDRKPLPGIRGGGGAGLGTETGIGAPASKKPSRTFVHSKV